MLGPILLISAIVLWTIGLTVLIIGIVPIVADETETPHSGPKYRHWYRHT